MVVRRPVPAAATSTRRFGLSPWEWATTALAAVVSTVAYLADGYPHLARGVVGDLLGFLVLGAVAALLRARLKHEALLCLLLIAAVLAVRPMWPLELSEPVWWTVFFIGLATYVAVRRRVCD